MQADSLSPIHSVSLPLHYQNFFVLRDSIRLGHRSPKRSAEKLSREQLLAVVANCTVASPSSLSIGGSFRVGRMCAAERTPLIEREADYPSGTSTPRRCFAFALLIFAVLKNTSSPEICAEPAVRNRRKSEQTTIKRLFSSNPHTFKCGHNWTC